jgi:hypothetical protein
VSEVVDKVLTKAVEDAVKRMNEASEVALKGLENLLYDLNPATILSRIDKALALTFVKARPPPPDQVVQELVEKGIPTPTELASTLPELLPTPKQLVEVIAKTADPTEKIKTIGLGVALPASIALGAILIVIALILTR